MINAYAISCLSEQGISWERWVCIWN